ncbi:hypothetical protein T484DRAFT_1557073, partial [Baffinella frigidus]
CIGCAANAYSATVGASSPDTCLRCPANTASVTNRSQVTDCKCLAGYVGADGTACTACALGTSYKEGTGVGVCESCPGGTYNNQEASVVCKSCPTNTYSATGSSQLADCLCRAGYIGAGGTACTACAIGTFA